MNLARLFVALGVGLALADASIVTLALPELIVELDTTVEGVAAVLGVYTLVLAAALVAAEWGRRRLGTARLGAAGFGLFALSGAACGIVDSLAPLLVLRALQALGGCAGLVCGFAFLARAEPGRERLWTFAAVIGAAAGPALGGVLTQLFEWRAIFLAQAPLGVAAAVAFASPGGPSLPPQSADAPQWPRHRARLGPALALALVSAALSAVLFLLVLLLVSGWSLSPIAAALVVAIVPAAALAGMRIPGPPRVLACSGCSLVGAGILALAFLPSASVAWTVLPQILAGLGMGLALTSLVGPLLPEETPRQTAGLLAIRHGGITLALVLLAPVVAAQLDEVSADTRERGAALVLDAPLGPLDKLDLASAVTGELDPVDPRDTLRRSLAEASPKAGEDPEGAAAYAELGRRADETLVAGVNRAFAPAFLITGALALVGALAVLPRERSARLGTLAVAAAALALSAGQVGLAEQARRAPVEIADPCQPRELPDAGGIGGIVQDAALVALDRAACRFGSSREELAIALADDDASHEYERHHGVDPRSIDLVRGVLGL